MSLSSLGGSLLIAQKGGLVVFDRSQVSFGVMTIVEPVLNQFQIVANTAAVDSDPVNALNPLAL